MLMYSNCSKVFRAAIFLHVPRLIRMCIQLENFRKLQKRLNDFAALLQRKMLCLRFDMAYMGVRSVAFARNHRFAFFLTFVSVRDGTIT